MADAEVATSQPSAPAPSAPAAAPRRISRPAAAPHAIELVVGDRRETIYSGESTR